MSVKAQEGGGLKVLVDMSAKNVIFFYVDLILTDKRNNLCRIYSICTYMNNSNIYFHLFGNFPQNKKDYFRSGLSWIHIQFSQSIPGSLEKAQKCFYFFLVIESPTSLDLYSSFVNFFPLVKKKIFNPPPGFNFYKQNYFLCVSSLREYAKV